MVHTLHPLSCDAPGRCLEWGAGEMQIVPWIFGIPHPTGFPVYTVLAGSFVHIVQLGATFALAAVYFAAG